MSRVKAKRAERVPTTSEVVYQIQNLPITRIRNCYTQAAEMLSALVELRNIYREIGLRYVNLLLERTALFENQTPWENAFDTETRAMLHNLYTQTCDRRATAQVLDCDERLLRVYTDASEVLHLTAYLNIEYRTDGRNYALKLVALGLRVEHGEAFDDVFNAAARAEIKKLRTSYNEAKALRSEEIDNPTPIYPPLQGGKDVTAHNDA